MTPDRPDRLTALYRRYGGAIYGRCRAILGDEAAAEDATQETFVRVHRHLDKTPDAGEALAWIWRIATNYCLNEVRDRRRRPAPSATLPEPPAPGATVEEALADRELLERVMERAGDKLRAVAWLCYIDGLEPREIGRVLGVSRRTVHNRLAALHDRARKIIARTTG